MNDTSVTLGINFYLSDNPQRMDELMQCLQYNLNNKSIDSIVMMLDTEAYNYLRGLKYHETGKIVFILGDGRPTYDMMFTLIDDLAKTDVRILANSDMFFPNSSMHHYKHLNPGEVWALSRWDEGKNKERKLWNHRDSQDVWAWKGAMVLREPADFTLGLPGCDNRIAKILLNSGYKVLNPSINVQTVHVHNTGHRTYDRSQTVQPPYHFIQPHVLQTYEVDTSNESCEENLAKQNISK